MTCAYDDKGIHVPLTVLQVQDCQVVGVRNNDRDGYTAVQLGHENVKASRSNKPKRGFYAAAKVEPKRVIKEFRVSEDAVLNIGDEIVAGHFIDGQKVDVTAVSKGKGFSGAMKRHNFGGLRASHGVSISHRSHGSTGQCQDPGRVFKGKKMAGQYGNKQITCQNIEVYKTDEQDNLIMVKGSVPGANGTTVFVKDAVKSKKISDLPFPAKIRDHKTDVSVENEGGE